MTGSNNGIVRAAVLGGFVVILVGFAGCGSGKQEKAELPPPMVTVAPPIERTVTRYETATGRVQAIDSVEIRARVSGYLKVISFQPGREVKKGDPLFTIDPEPFQADLAKAKASVEVAEADLKAAEAESTRSEAKLVTNKKTYDREQEAFVKGVGSEMVRDVAKGAYEEANASALGAKAKIKLSKAKIDEGKASAHTAELNLGYCTITAPISGIVGDRLVTEGNLVTANSTLLTTVVSVDKMDVGFDVDENTLQRIQQAVREGKIKVNAPGEIPAEAGISIHGAGYPLNGKINFSDNQFDQKTGTIRMKARFDNAKPAVGQRLLAVGMYARIRVPIGEPVKAMLVPDSAFGSDQGIKFLYLIGPENKAIRMDAKIGLLEGDMRVVESVDVPGEGKPRPLTPSDQVIISGLQRVRAGMIVDPKQAKK
jgi:RND family efflux transporter MFP subunit